MPEGIVTVTTNEPSDRTSTGLLTSEWETALCTIASVASLAGSKSLPATVSVPPTWTVFDDRTIDCDPGEWLGLGVAEGVEDEVGDGVPGATSAVTWSVVSAWQAPSKQRRMR